MPAAEPTAGEFCLPGDFDLLDAKKVLISACLKLQCSLMAVISFSICFLERLTLGTKSADLMSWKGLELGIGLPKET